MLEQLRLAHLEALSAVFAAYERQHMPGDDSGRAATDAGYALHERLRQLCSTEANEARNVRFGLRDTTREDERRVRAAFLSRLPDAFDSEMANRRLPSDPSDVTAPNLDLRRSVEDAALAELKFLLRAPPVEHLGLGATLWGWIVAWLPGPEAPSAAVAAISELPADFETLFLGVRGKSDGWFDYFVLQAARRLRENDKFRGIWNAEQQSAIKNLGQVQNHRLDEVAAGLTSLATFLIDALGRIEASLQRVEAGIGRVEAGVRELLDRQSGVRFQSGYAPLAADQVARLPTALAVADYGVIPYDDSRGLLGEIGDGRSDTLLGWVTRGIGVRVRLYVAPGGQGKTRLVLEAIARLNARPALWQAGLLTRDALAQALERPAGAPDGPLARILAARRATAIFLAIDYAETRPEQLLGLAQVLADAPAGGPIRVVLLARTDGWWNGFRESLRNRQELLFEPEPVSDIGASISKADRRRYFDAACAAFAGQLSRADAEDTRAPPLLAADWQARPADAPLFVSGSPLELAIRAYLHVRSPRGSQPSAAKSPLAEMAEEERFHIARALRRATGRSPSRALVELGFRCAAGVTLIWGLAPAPAQGEAALLRLIDCIAGGAPLYPPGSLETDPTEAGLASEAVRRALRILYGGRNESMRPIVPDLLGEQAVGETLQRMPSLLPLLLDAFPEDWIRALILLNRITRQTRDAASVHDQDTVVEPARAALRQALSPRLPLPGFAHALLAAALADEGLIQEDAASVLAGLSIAAQSRAAAAIRTAGSDLVSANAAPVRLRAFLGAAARADIAGVAPEGAGDDAVRSAATAANNRSVLLANAGLRDEALAASEEAVKLYRELVGKNRDAFLPDLAGALNNVSNDLSNLGRRDEALAASEEAVKLYRELVGKNRDAFLPDLAGALNNLGATRSNLGGRDEALTASEEAVKLYRELVGKNRDAFLPDLASALNNVSGHLSNLGRRDEALAASEEAVKLYRELVGKNRDAFLPDLASALNNLGIRFSNLGRRDEALAASEEAVKLRRELVGKNRDAFLPDLASALNNLGAMRSNLGRRDEALAASEEAVKLYRELAGENRDAFLPDLAGALNNVSGDLSNLGRRDEALAASEEAVKLYRELVGKNRNAFLRDLVTALGGRGTALLATGGRERAVEAADCFAEGARLLRPLATAQPAAFGDLFQALARDLVRALQAAGREGEIAAHLAELGLDIAPPASDVSPALAEAMRLLETWVQLHNDAVRSQSEIDAAKANAAFQALSAHMAAVASDPALAPVRDALADIMRQLGDTSGGDRP